MKHRKLGARATEWLPHQAAKTAPGWGPNSRVRLLDGPDIMVAGLPDRVMVEIYKQIKHPRCKYIPGVFDCENFSRWYASQVTELWGRLILRKIIKSPMILDQGVVLGKIPIGQLPAGNHAANFFFNDKGIYRMWEPQQRRLLTVEEVARSEEIWELEYH